MAHLCRVVFPHGDEMAAKFPRVVFASHTTSRGIERTSLLGVLNRTGENRTCPGDGMMPDRY